MILLTDGANTAGEVSPLKAAQLAAERNLKIYTIGIGADEQIEMTWFGMRRVNPSARLDEKTLRAIADLTGGRYFRARDSDELEKIYLQLDDLAARMENGEIYVNIHTVQNPSGELRGQLALIP